MLISRQEGRAASTHGCSPLFQIKGFPVRIGLLFPASTSHARIRLWAATGSAKEPGEVGSAILGVLSEVVDAMSEVAKLEHAVPVASCLGRYITPTYAIEGIEVRPLRWHGTASTILVASGLRGQRVSLKLQDGIPVRIGRAATCCKARSSKPERGSIVLCPVGPIRLIRCPIEVGVKPKTTSKYPVQTRRETRSIIGITVAVRPRLEVTDLGGKSDIGLQRGPGHKVAEPGRRELGVKTEVGSAAVCYVQTLELIGRARDHEATLASAQIIDPGSHTAVDVTRCIVDGHFEPVALVHQQGLCIRRE